MIKTHLTQRSPKCSMNPRLPLCKLQCMIESKFIKHIIFRLPVPLKPIFVLFLGQIFYLLYIATVPFFFSKATMIYTSGGNKMDIFQYVTLVCMHFRVRTAHLPFISLIFLLFKYTLISTLAFESIQSLTF